MVEHSYMTKMKTVGRINIIQNYVRQVAQLVKYINKILQFGPPLLYLL
jgi:hypothetical protein